MAQAGQEGATETEQAGVTGMDTEEVSTADLVPWEKNPRTITDHDMEALRRSIREYGFVEPLVIDEDNPVIGGHQRLKAAKAEGLDTVPCVRVKGLSDPEKQARAITIPAPEVMVILGAGREWFRLVSIPEFHLRWDMVITYSGQAIVNRYEKYTGNRVVTCENK